MLRIDDFRRNLPHESDRWATSDRGWAWEPGAEKCFAHYLDYERDYAHEGKRVHVFIVATRTVVWVRTVRDARVAIKAAYRRFRRARAREHR